MRQVSFDEAGAVSGAGCGDLTISVNIAGGSISGSLDTWSSCFDGVSAWLGDTYNSFSSHYTTGIPYGEAHVG